MFHKVQDKLTNWNSELSKAVKKGDVDRLYECVNKHGAKINKHFHSTCDASHTYNRDKHPLIIALLNNDIPMLKAIIELGGKHEIQNYPILNEAFIEGRITVETLNFMIEQGALLDGALPHAVAYNWLKATEALLKASTEINKLYFFYLDYLPYLSHHNKDHALTVLMIAASNNNADMVELLLKNGADATVRDIYNSTAEEYATEYSIKLLIRKAKSNQISIQEQPMKISNFSR